MDIISYVIDLGSSGVRLGGLKVNYAQKTAVEVFHRKERIRLQASIRDGVLPKKMVDRIVDSINRLLLNVSVAYSERDTIVAYATAWARSMTNKGEVIREIKEQTNVSVNIIDQETEGKYGFHAVLAALRSMEQFTPEWHDVHTKLSGPLGVITTNVMSWDIGGGSMQFARQDGDETVHVIGSIDSTTIFANAVITKVKKQDPVDNTPNPLSPAEHDLVIEMSMQIAKDLVTEEFLLCCMHPDDSVIMFGIGYVHLSNRQYVNRLLGLCHKNFYERLDLKKAAGLLITKNNKEIGDALGITEADARNRFTSMLLVLGFMQYMNLERVYTLEVASMVGALLMKLPAREQERSQ